MIVEIKKSLSGSSSKLNRSDRSISEFKREEAFQRCKEETQKFCYSLRKSYGKHSIGRAEEINKEEIILRVSITEERLQLGRSIKCHAE